VQRRVALQPVGRVALEVFLVEEEVDDLVCGRAKAWVSLRDSEIGEEGIGSVGVCSGEGVRGGGRPRHDVQFPWRAASWYRWFPMTVVVLFRRPAISVSLLPSSVSCISSRLLRRQASMRISFAEAPCGEGAVSALV